MGIYLCGPTVYREAHIGHMVGPVIFDTIKRYLAYCGYDVTWVVNITDVDDKLIAESNRRNISMSQVAEEMTADYVANLEALGVDQIDHMPKATDNMEEILQFIQQLAHRIFRAWTKFQRIIVLPLNHDHRQTKLVTDLVPCPQGINYALETSQQKLCGQGIVRQTGWFT